MTFTKSGILLTFSLLVLVGYISYNEYRTIDLQKSLTDIKTQQKNTVDKLDVLKASSTNVSASLTNLYATLSTVSSLADKIGSISNTVNTLDKLSKTDDQLLKKYSQVYFLNDNYVPSSLTNVPTDYLTNPQSIEQVHTSMLPFMINMINDGRANNIHLLVGSSYRSFATQSTLKAGYKVTYGAGTANKFSAEQGFSEHQLGTAVDFTTDTMRNIDSGFDKTNESIWLQNNAYRYGFVLSYPKGNKYYMYESWHWRFVGVKLATYLHNENLHFYDMDQRDIDKYLISIFDN
jgi:LAS superfamily LD-carboxypeptidase LdcB